MHLKRGTVQVKPAEGPVPRGAKFRQTDGGVNGLGRGQQRWGRRYKDTPALWVQIEEPQGRELYLGGPFIFGHKILKNVVCNAFFSGGSRKYSKEFYNLFLFFDLYGFNEFICKKKRGEQKNILGKNMGTDLDGG